MPIRSRTVETRLMATYLMPPSSCALSPPRTRRPKEAISITSNQTYRLNKSPVTKAPQIPAKSTWNSA